ncbi:hypothetical protein CCH79_00005039 [Gambusia affinis]|uniref:Peptidase S1 domain-containing protein n=1 Tax=Gambusia affinis TaxID=33528 RepID=A0A315V8G4_GAMAF|nr:hypothetical protein CCH79_00005039 [Gambusia affinis]
MFCTRPTELEENICFGDAGGALAVRDAQSGDVYAAGILSYDKSCNRNSYELPVAVSGLLLLQAMFQHHDVLMRPHEGAFLYRRHLFICDMQQVESRSLTGPTLNVVKPGAKVH